MEADAQAGNAGLNRVGEPSATLPSTWARKYPAGPGAPGELGSSWAGFGVGLSEPPVTPLLLGNHKLGLAPQLRPSPSRAENSPPRQRGPPELLPPTQTRQLCSGGVWPGSPGVRFRASQLHPGAPIPRVCAALHSRVSLL